MVSLSPNEARNLIRAARYSHLQEVTGRFYAFTASGWLVSKRYWARGPTATYTYNNAGELSAIT